MSDTEQPDLPPEPGSVPDPDHGIPGDAEPLPTNAAAVAPEDDAPEDYSDDDLDEG